VPVVFEDPLALRILGREQAEALRASSARVDQGSSGSFLRTFLAARSRVAEDMLQQHVAAGVRQYVVLGAGLDTFAYRNPYFAERLRVFEVDHPSTQVWKRELLASAGIVVPDTLTFVPVDFERQQLVEELELAGFAADDGAFFSWLGVTPYLDISAVRATLASVAALTRAGGGIVFDYAVPLESLGVQQRAAVEALAARAGAAGEPWRTYLDPEALERDVRALGFSDVVDLSGEALNARYFAGRADGLRVGLVGRILVAARPSRLHGAVTAR
jgi:methyltransferase (TIGR00027 family)